MEAQDNVVVVKIPTTISYNVYSIWIYDNVSSTSNTVAINAPQVANFQFGDLYPGQTPPIVGRNMCMNGQTPTVTLVDTKPTPRSPR